MADGEKNNKSLEPSEERFKYIGFDVFPGKAGDMFKSDEERKSWVEKIKSKLARSAGEVRDRCTLMESRVSPVERVFLALAAVLMIFGLFIPWFSGYIPVSYEELGSFGDHTFFFASKDDEKSVNDLAEALKKKHERLYTNTMAAAAANEMEESPADQPAEQPVVQQPADEGESTENTAVAGEEVSDDEITEGDATTSQELETTPPPQDDFDDEDQLHEEIKVIFVNIPQIDDIHGLDDLSDHVVALYTYNARTGRENLVIGGANALRTIPQDMTLKAAANDSISAAVTDSLKQAATERIAAGDSGISVDSIFYAGPTLVKDKPVSELADKGIVNDYYSITGFGAILSIGTFGSKVFSSGIVLIITGILLLVYFLCCLALAGLNLYLLFGAKKGTGEQTDLYMKRMLRYNWVPVMVWLVMFVISFFGASYGFDSAGMLKQVGNSYGIAAFMGLSSFGIYVTLAAFLIAALKGKEI